MNWTVSLRTTLLLVGCACANSNTEGDACGSGAACVAGAVCIDGECLTLCAADSDCDGPGRICEDRVCIVGQRTGMPVIASVDGDSVEACSGTNGKHCVSLGIAVTGERLSGAAWSLTPARGGHPADLALRANASDASVTLDLPADIAPGQYVLRATNSAGSADQALELLRGEPGPQGERGEPGPQGALDEAQVAAMNARIDAMIPIGTVLPYAAEVGTIPDGWLLCDGAEISRDEYGNLFGIIGINHGGGDGTNTFNLPDLRGRFLRGVAGSLGTQLASVRDPDRNSRVAPQPGAASSGNHGNAVGSVEATATALPNAGFTISTSGIHTHIYNDNSGWRREGTPNRVDSGGTNESGYREDRSFTTAAGGAHGHAVSGGDAESRPPNSYVHFIIKY
jgi:microcystin-dependent protein